MAALHGSWVKACDDAQITCNEEEWSDWRMAVSEERYQQVMDDMRQLSMVEMPVLQYPSPAARFGTGSSGAAVQSLPYRDRTPNSAGITPGMHGMDNGAIISANPFNFLFDDENKVPVAVASVVVAVEIVGLQSPKRLLKEGAEEVGEKLGRKASNLNGNSATSNFGIYELDVKGELNKIGKADLNRVTQSSGLPTRLHQQVRKLEEEHGKGNVVGQVVENLGRTTTARAKAAETARSRARYRETGTVPPGNRKSFKP